jgi:hypothetical protein
VTYQQSDSEKTIFGIAYAISRELIDMYPGCGFGYFCEPPNYIAMTVINATIEIVNLLYLLWLLRQPEDSTEGPKRELLTYEAENMAVEIEGLIRDYGGRNLDNWVQGAKPRFWYSGPFFDDAFLHENAHAVGSDIGMSRDIVDRLWNSKHHKAEIMANKRVSTYSFPYPPKLEREKQVHNRTTITKQKPKLIAKNTNKKY